MKTKLAELEKKNRHEPERTLTRHRIRQSRISEFETGRIPTANMTLKTAVCLAKALNAHAEDLLD